MKTSTKRAARSKAAASHPLRWIYILSLAVAIIIVGGIASWSYVSMTYKGDNDTWIYIPGDSDHAAVKDSLVKNLGDTYGACVYRVWDLFGGKPQRARGAYRVAPGEKAYTVARNIKNGLQTPINVTFNNARTLEQMARKVARAMDWSAEDFIAACDSILPAKGYTREQFPAAFLPDTYQAYWTQSPADLISTMLHFRDKFWDERRREKARKLGLSEVDVATIASIVEEETAKCDERPMIARLYINRVEKKMKLQADPTVKFAVGDFSLRRILNKHLGVESPYNTYRVAGLPPGPIRFAEGATIDAVLDAPEHHYLYMCAKEDFSGYHNFATDYPTHLANARRYQQALNERGIK